jgi:hypothetical protein
MLPKGLSSFCFALFLAVTILYAAAPQPPTRNPNKSASPSCNVTIPNGSQPPVKDFGGRSSLPNADYPGSYGNGMLWTSLPVDGMLRVVPDEQGNLGEKWLWYRTVRGHLSVSGRRLDGPGNFQTGPLEELDPRRDTGLLVKTLFFPSEGCWQITGSAGGSHLTFVLKVQAKK